MAAKKKTPQGLTQNGAAPTSVLSADIAAAGITDRHISASALLGKPPPQLYDSLRVMGDVSALRLSSNPKVVTAGPNRTIEAVAYPIPGFRIPQMGVFIPAATVSLALEKGAKATVKASRAEREAARMAKVAAVIAAEESKQAEGSGDDEHIIDEDDTDFGDEVIEGEEVATDADEP